MSRSTYFSLGFLALLMPVVGLLQCRSCAATKYEISVDPPVIEQRTSRVLAVLRKEKRIETYELAVPPQFLEVDRLGRRRSMFLMVQCSIRKDGRVRSRHEPDWEWFKELWTDDTGELSLSEWEGGAWMLHGELLTCDIEEEALDDGGIRLAFNWKYYGWVLDNGYDPKEPKAQKQVVVHVLPAPVLESTSRRDD